MFYGQDYFKKLAEENANGSNTTNWWQNGGNNWGRSTSGGYVESAAVQDLKKQLESHGGLKPADYTSKWQAQIDSMANDIMNRKEFQYDVNADALYNQYKDRYVSLGQQAMMDTMGQAAQLTGGYGNSYAQMAGQQAYQGYLQGLTDKIPELAQLAQARYDQQGQDLYNKYGLLNTQEQNAYNNWLNSYNQWLAERDYLAGRYDTERGYDYGVYRDAVADAQWQKQFEEDLRRYNLEMALQHGGGSGGSGGGGGGSKGGGYGSGYSDALLLVENSTTSAGQEKIIQHAYDTGQITKSGAEELAKKVGNTTYTK